METQTKCFEMLVEKDLPVLRAAAYRILRNAADADEAVQNALLAAWKKFRSFRQESELFNWVYRITVNMAYDQIRARKKESAQLSLYAANAPESSAAAQDKLDSLERAIAALPEIYREAISVGFLSGFSGERASEILKCSPDTLYQRIHRAKEMIRKTMNLGDEE